MGVPAKLTERQIKFSELLVYNEGRMSPAECAKEAGYKTRPRQAASELRNPKYSPLVVRYIGELRAEVQEKYGVNLRFFNDDYDFFIVTKQRVRGLKFNEIKRSLEKLFEKANILRK